VALLIVGAIALFLLVAAEVLMFAPLMLPDCPI
jgi:hypothetical protein